MRLKARSIYKFGVLLAALGGSVSAAAVTSFPMIQSTYPTGVQRGKTTLVTVYTGGSDGGGGTSVYGAYKALFTGTGVKAEIVPPEKGWPAKDPKKPFELPAAESVTMRVTVAADAPLGTREYRVATPRHGISTVGLLVIGDQPEMLEAEPNNDPEHAQMVTLPMIVNGKIQQAEDVDWYKFKATAGQEVTFDVIAARLEDKIHDLGRHLDPLIILKDLAGNELARDDDYYRADPLLHYKFDKTGDYLIQIRDVGYAGNGAWVYRLEMTTRPYVTAVVPAAVVRGQSASLRLTGYNLAGAQTAHLDVPADAPPGIWYTPLTLPNGTTNLVPLLVTDAPQTSFDNPPHAAGAVTASLKADPAAIKGRLTLPGGANSWLASDGELDRYAFHAKKGESWGFEVTARRLDSEIDSVLRLFDAKGNRLAENDDAFGKDSRIEWSVPADGDYTIEVRDLAGHSGPSYFYNLTAERLHPDFTLKCDTDRAMIAPGNRTAWFIMLDRKYGFAGPVKIDFSGLPAGVTASPLTIPPDMAQGAVVLSAAADAKIDMNIVQIVGSGTLTGANGKPADVTRIATPLQEIYIPGGGRGIYPVQSQGVAVTEPNDIEVSVDSQQITLAPGGTAKIAVSIKRRADYTKSVTLDLRVNHLGTVFTNPLPPGVTVADGVTIGDNQNTGTIVLTAAKDAHPIKDWPIAVMANCSINFVMKVWYAAPPVMLTVTAPPKK